MVDWGSNLEGTPKGKQTRTVNGKTVRVCDDCGANMVVRKNRATGEAFLGCQNYPECLHTEPLPMDAQMRAAGVKMLPGLD